MHAGMHETVASLFESLLGLPEFLDETMWLNEPQVRQLVAFDTSRICSRHVARSRRLTVCDAWMEHLDWAEIERRYASYCRSVRH